MKKIIISLMLAGFVPASGAAQSSTPGSVTAQVSSTPPCRARTLDLRASGPGYATGCGTSTTALPAKWNTAGIVSSPHSTDEVDANGVDYCVAAANVILGTTLTHRSPGFIDCGAESGDKTIPSKGAKPQSTNFQDSCAGLYSWGLDLSKNQDWLASYDSLKKYINLCANTPESYRAFDLMSDDVSQLERTDTALWSDYQLWLRAVLYLNTIDPEYFCSCVEQLSPWVYYTQAYIPDHSPGQLYMYKGDTSIIILNWLINNTTCDTHSEDILYNQSRLSDSEEWAQYQSEGYHYPYDTTIPPLTTFGLDTLLERHFLFSVSEPPQQGILSNATANPNPLNQGTVISFGISKEAYVKIDLFDLLGQSLSSVHFESLFAPGSKSVPISLMGLPSGTPTTPA